MKTRAKYSLILFSVLLTFVLLVPLGVVAQDDDDPPSRVARLGYVNGQVSFNPSGTDDWVSAVLNRPVTTGDKLWSDQNSRAEMHIGSAVLRMGGMTGISFLNLDDRIMQISLTEGTLNIHVRRLDQDESIEIDTPNLAFSVLRPGSYRLNVNENGDTTIINVRDGEGEITGGGSAYTIHANQQGYFMGTDTLDADVQALPDEDGFDRWCRERDLREEHAVARRYVSDEVIGYEDLDDYGGWRSVPEYGTVWFPHVTVVDWAPYRYGHWVWISPWGWTWVDDAPWGFAPFHYGRWVFVGGAWGWVPCPPRTVAVAYVRPVYAPALVAWVGGPHFAAGIAFGGGGGVGVNVGWFPLGPREVYVPSYRVSRTYINNVNISNTTVNQTVINNYYNTTVVNKNVTVNNVTYVNQRVPGGVTATSGRAFTSAQPVSRNIVAVNQREVVAAPAVVRGPAIVPPKQAVLGGGNVTNAHPPMQVQTRPVVAKTPPPPPPPPFAARQAAIERNQGQPISMAESRQLANTQPHNNVAPVRVAPPARTVMAPPVRQPGDRNVPPGRVNANRPPNTNQPNAGQPGAARPNVAQPSTAQPEVQPNQQNRPKDMPSQQDRPGNAPGNVPNQQNRPNNVPSQQDRPGNAPGNAPNQPNANPRMDRPPSARPVPPVNQQLEQKHQQQVEQLQQKQDQQYQKLQQKQMQEQQKLQQRNADQARQQQMQQREQQQRQQLEQRQVQQQQNLERKQQAEHDKAYKPPKEQKEKPPKEEKDKDKPKH